MPIRKFEQFLPEELYEEAIETANYILTLGGNELFTNYYWDHGIRKDSFPVLIHNIYKDTNLYKKLRENIEEKTGKNIVDDNIMIYFWTRYSYIPWHNDNVHYDGAITVYLNREWDRDFGGYFLYEENDEIKAILPKRNLAVMQYDSLMHCTTPVNFSGEMRITIQSFLKK
jgi:hypothetical protein